MSNKQEARQERRSWLISFLLVIFLVTARPFTKALGLRPVDLFFSLEIFACFFCCDWRILVMSLLAAALKEVMFGQIFGPSLILTVLLVYLSYLIRYIRQQRSWGWSFLFAGVLYPLFSILQAILFHILPLKYKAELTLGARISSMLLAGLQGLPGILLGLLMIILIFKISSPHFYREESLS